MSARPLAASLSRDTKERQRPAPWEQQVRGGRTVVHVQEKSCSGSVCRPRSKGGVGWSGVAGRVQWHA